MRPERPASPSSSNSRAVRRSARAAYPCTSTRATGGASGGPRRRARPRGSASSPGSRARAASGAGTPPGRRRRGRRNWRSTRARRPPADAAPGTGQGCPTSRRDRRPDRATGAWRPRCRGSGRRASRRARRAPPRAARAAPCPAPRRGSRPHPPEAAAEQADRVLGDPRHEGERLHGGDEAVAPEQRREPGDAGGEVGLAVELGPQHVEVPERPGEDAVEQLVVGADPGRFGRRAPGRRGGGAALARADPQLDPPLAAGGELDSKRSTPPPADAGTAQPDGRGANHSVAPGRGTAQRRSSRAGSTGGRSGRATRPRTASIGSKSAPRRSSSPSRRRLGRGFARETLDQPAGLLVEDALDPQRNRLRGVCQLVQRPRAEGVGGLEQDRRLAAEQQAMRGQMAAVAVPEPEAWGSAGSPPSRGVTMNRFSCLMTTVSARLTCIGAAFPCAATRKRTGTRSEQDISRSTAPFR